MHICPHTRHAHPTSSARGAYYANFISNPPRSGCTTELDPIYKEGDDLGAEESWLDIDWVLSNDNGRTPRCTSNAGAGPSHTTGHEDTVPTQTTARGASTDYEDPRHMLPPVFSGSAHDGGCIFVPTPGMPTPPLVHVEPTMPT